PENVTNNRGAEYQPRYICSECFVRQESHFYEQYSCGYPKFDCKHLHKNDANDELQIL
ncbi:35185_t:CDS:1, partial [Racocetra persica]